jgi:uncharacterized protein YdhG (YjbR/CyaY superfamily)
MKETTMAAKGTTAPEQEQAGFSDFEKTAMRARAQELKAERRRGSAQAKALEAEKAVLAKIGEMNASDRALAERIHAIVKESAPDLTPKLWYGMPTYARDGKNVCFFQAAEKFEARYATLGFDESAHLDDGTMWPTAFAITELTPANEARIAELVKKAVS